MTTGILYFQCANDSGLSWLYSPWQWYIFVTIANKNANSDKE